MESSRRKYSLNDFTLGRTVGTGGFGRVRLAQSRHNKRLYAVKVLKCKGQVEMKQVDHTNNELRIWSSLSHLFIAKFWGGFLEKQSLYTVMQFVEGGELFSLIKRSQVCHPLYSNSTADALKTTTAAFSKHGCKVLRRRSSASTRIPAFTKDYL
jgi:protein kinase A